MLKRARGFSLIELIVTMVIFAIAMAIAVPNFSAFVRNSRIRTFTESVQNGLQYARSEAVRRNTPVRFQLTSTTDNGCALSASGTNWVVSLDDPTSKCGATPLDDSADPTTAAAPRLLQSRSASEGQSSTLTVAASGPGTNAHTITFNGLGRLPTGTTTTASIDVSISGQTCKSSGGTSRCLRVVVSPGGQIRMCDPSMGASNPQGCP